MAEMDAEDKVLIALAIVMFVIGPMLLIGGGILAGRLSSVAVGSFDIGAGLFLMRVLYEKNKTS